MSVSPGPAFAVPEIVGVVLLVVCGVTVGVIGAVVSISNSLELGSMLRLPARSVMVAVTSYNPSTNDVGIESDQVPSPLSVKLPSPAV